MTTPVHPRTRRNLTWLPMALAAGLLLTSACTGGSSGAPSGGGADPSPALRLASFDSCEQAAQRLRAAAQEQVTPWGIGAAVAATAMDGQRLAAPDAAQDQAGPAAALEAAPGGQPAAPGGQAPAAQRHSSTNVHEAGVDEPDLVKTDGRRIVTVADGMLRVVDAARAVETGTLALFEDTGHPYGAHAADLLLHGDRALVLTRGAGGPMPLPEPAGVAAPAPELLPMPPSGARLLLVDLAGQPRVLSEYTVDGALLDARAVGGTARVVIRSFPRLDLPTLDHDATEQERLAANRDAVSSADVSDWLPRYTVTTGGDTSTGQVDCTAVSHPEDYSGTSMLTVLTFDVTAATLGDGAPVSVVADGDTVYSNGSSLYVANDQRWRLPVELSRDDQPESTAHTEIYKFDVAGAGPPRYVAAGAVDGWLINQYAMSEWDGHLRVATTTGDVWGWGAGEPDSESAVSVLAERDGALVEVGAVGGLGAGERIYAVRYAGPVGYVVTFRETDPLYTLDLSDPFAPTALGELKITGYSSYLHDVGDGRLVGVGQEADLQGVVQGTQISLFDVSDLSDPQLRDQHHVPHGHSEAESDPHAFLWWPDERMLVVPLNAPGGGVEPGTTRPADRWSTQQGALVLRVDTDTLVAQDLISHPDGHGAIRRSLVVGDTLWTVSASGMQANDLATRQAVAWLPFE